MEIHTKEMTVKSEEKNIDVHVNYGLDVNGEMVADCNIEMNIKALDR